MNYHAYELTPKQEKALDYLKQKIKEKGRSPSLRQAAADLGISHAAVAQFIRALEKKGFLRRGGRYGRNIVLLDNDPKAAFAHNWRAVPIIGKINAGYPLYAQQEWDGGVVVDKNIYKGQNLFALRVKGDSMQNAGILHQDLVICEPRQYAQNGDIVVALINHEEATVKRFFLHKDHIELRPENEKYSAAWYSFGDVLVQGKVIGVQRGPDQFI
jgi:repressor LexA